MSESNRYSKRPMLPSFCVHTKKAITKFVQILICLSRFLKRERPSPIWRFFRRLFPYLLLLVILVAIRTPILEANSNTALWDDTFFISIGNSLRNGQGFTVGFLSDHELGANIDYQSYLGYPSILHPMAYAPLYPLYVGLILVVTNANPSNWYIMAANGNMILVYILLLVSYRFAKSLFNKEVALTTVIFFLIWSALFMGSARVIREPLLWIFILLTFYLAIRAKSFMSWMGVGILCALAHLTHPVGMATVGSIFLWLLIERKFRNAVTVLGAYILSVIPWLVKNQLVFYESAGDWAWGVGMGYPFATFARLLGFGSYVSSAHTHTLPSLLNPIESLIYAISNMLTVDGMLSMLILLLFVPIAYFKAKSPCTRIPKASVPINQSGQKQDEREALQNTKIQASPLLHVDLYSSGMVYKLRSFFVFAILNLLTYFAIAISMSRVNAETRFLFPTFLILLPTGIYGLFRFLDKKTLSITITVQKIRKITMHLHDLKALATFVLILVSLIGLVNFQNWWMININTPNRDLPVHSVAHAKLMQITSPDEILASNAPTLTFIRTGRSSFLANTADLSTIEMLFNKYDPKHFIVYGYLNDRLSSFMFESMDSMHSIILWERIFVDNTGEYVISIFSKSVRNVSRSLDVGCNEANFWQSKWESGEGTIGPPEIVFKNSSVNGVSPYNEIDIPSGNSSVAYVGHDFSEPLNFSSFDFLSLRWLGSGIVRIYLYGPSDQDWLWYELESGGDCWRTYYIPLSEPCGQKGTPNLSQVNSIVIAFINFNEGTYGLEDCSLIDIE